MYMYNILYACICVCLYVYNFLNIFKSSFLSNKKYLCFVAIPFTLILFDGLFIFSNNSSFFFSNSLKTQLDFCKLLV